MRITDKKIEKLKGKEKRYTVALGDSLFLRVSPSGHKSYCFRFYFKGKVRDLTLGTWPELKVMQAIQCVHLKREELQLKPSIGLTFKDGYKLWQNKKKGHIVSYDNECKRIERHLLPYLSKLQLEQISAPIALNVMLKLDNKLPTLKRCLMRLNEILELCVCAGLLEQNPCRRLSRVFANHQPINRPFIRAERLHELFALLKDEPIWFHLFALWAVYSMLRPVECVSIKWSWIENDVITLPSEIMKKRRPHRVPLCQEIIQIFTELKRIRKRRSVYVFSFGRSGRCLNKQYLSKWLTQSDLKGQLCHHGLRATARTWMRDNKVSYEVAEDALAHLSGSQTERAYLRGDYLEQRKDIMQKWWQYIYSQYCASCAPLSFLE